MAVSPVDPKAAQAQAQAQDMQMRAQQINSLAPGLGGRQPVDKEKKLRESCEGFESIFIQKMWEQMRATVPKSNLLQGREEQFWQGMFDQELSKKMASAGGIGLADMMYEQLSRNLVSASRTTASAAATASGGKEGGFTATAAPLLPETPPRGGQYAALAEKNPASAAQAARGHGIYAGEATQPQAQGAEGAHPEAGQQADAAPVDTETSPVVQQFLAELRQRQAAAQNPPVTTSVTQVHGNGLAQQARLTAGNRPPANGVMPPMQAVQRQQMTGQPAAGQQMMGQQTAAYMAAQQMPGHPAPAGQPSPSSPFVLPAAAPQTDHTPLASQFIMNPAPAQAAGGMPTAAQNLQAMGAAAQLAAGSMPAQQANPAAGHMPMQMTQPHMTQPQPAAGHMPLQGMMPGAQQATAQAAALTAQQPAQQAAGQQTAQNPAQQPAPEVINTTFTTNIPPKNRKATRPKGSRVPSGQPLIRTLNTDPASPITQGSLGRGAAQPAAAADAGAAAAQPAGMEAAGAPGTRGEQG